MFTRRKTTPDELSLYYPHMFSKATKYMPFKNMLGIEKVLPVVPILVYHQKPVGLLKIKNDGETEIVAIPKVLTTVPTYPYFKKYLPQISLDEEPNAKEILKQIAQAPLPDEEDKEHLLELAVNMLIALSKDIIEGRKCKNSKYIWDPASKKCVKKTHKSD